MMPILPFVFFNRSCVPIMTHSNSAEGYLENSWSPSHLCYQPSFARSKRGKLQLGIQAKASFPPCLSLQREIIKNLEILEHAKSEKRVHETPSARHPPSAPASLLALPFPLGFLFGTQMAAHPAISGTLVIPSR